MPTEVGPILRRRAVRRLIRIEVTDVISETLRRLNEASIASVADLRGLPYDVVGFSDDLRAKNRELKDFLMARFYRHFRVNRMAAKARRLLSLLFTAYVSDPCQLPREVQYDLYLA